MGRSSIETGSPWFSGTVMRPFPPLHGNETVPADRCRKKNLVDTNRGFPIVTNENQPLKFGWISLEREEPMSDFSSPAMQAIQHLNNKFDEIGDDIQDFMVRQASGEEPDPQEFAQLMQAQSAVKSALGVQFNLQEKPFKTVLNEVRG
jgi:hypothetical protein